MMNEAILESYFPTIAVEPQQDPQQVIVSWKQSLQKMVRGISDNPWESKTPGWETRMQEWDIKITEWEKHPDHGATHSFAVYTGMRYLAKQDGLQVDDQMLQVLAVFHDIAQSFPLRKPFSGNEIPGDARKRHAETIAEMIYLYGQHFGLSDSNKRKVISAIRHHDDAYTHNNNMSHGTYADILSDADKLFGNGVATDGDQLAKLAVTRNGVAAQKRDGWYAFRDDLTLNQRRAWQYGDRWYQDRLSAILYETDVLTMHTPTGQRLMEQRALAMPHAFIEAMVALLNKTHETLRTNPSDGLYYLVGKGVEEQQPLSGPIAKAVIDRAYTYPLTPPIAGRNGIPRGMKLLVGDTVIDPSIARLAYADDGSLLTDTELKQQAHEIEKRINTIFTTWRDT